MIFFRKYTLSISIAALLCCQLFAQLPASDDLLSQQKHYVVKSNPLLLIWGSIPFTSEFRLVQEATVSKKQSTQLWVSGYLKSPLLLIGERVTKSGATTAIRGYRVQLAHKFYLGKNTAAPEGFYFGPQVSYTDIRMSLKQWIIRDVYIQGKQVNLVCLLGYQTIGKNMAFDIFAGLGYKTNFLSWHYSPRRIIPIPLEDVEGLSFILKSPVKFTFGMNFGFVYE